MQTLTDRTTHTTPSGDGPRPHALNTATLLTGRLLCLSLAVSMAVAAVDAFASPEASWWQYVWPFTAVLLVAWVTLRTQEKRHAPPVTGPGRDD